MTTEPEPGTCPAVIGLPGQDPHYCGEPCEGPFCDRHAWLDSDDEDWEAAR